MEIIVKNIPQKSVELTEDQFKNLISDMVPATVENVRQVAVDILTSDNGRPESIMESIERCRRFLNTQSEIRKLMHAFNTPTEKCEKTSR